MAKLINTAELTRILHDQLTESMLAEAEPILQKALVDIEKKMRKDLAVNLIKFVQSDYSVQTMRDEIIIRVNTNGQYGG